MPSGISPNHTTCGRKEPELAAMAFIFWGNVSGPVENLTTLRTTNFQQFPMHMNHIGITCAFMQVVYILRHQQKAIAESILQI